MVPPRWPWFVTIPVLAAWLWAPAAEAFASLKFEPYKPPDTYKCGEFMASAINDPAMQLFHKFINSFIRQLSLPFPHEKLLSKEAIQGDLRELQTSFSKNYIKWIDFEFNWLVVCAALVVLSTVFMLAYFLYRCCACCCALRRSRAAKKSRASERRCDGCQRVFFDIIVGTFIIVNLFVSVLLLMSTQYAQFGIEELPSRLNYCVNDLSVYKFENHDRMRKLLRDDFQVLNTTLIENVNTIGDEVVGKFKSSTGVVLLDELAVHLEDVQRLQEDVERLRNQLAVTQSAKTVAAGKLAQLRDSSPILERCAGVPEDVPPPQAQAATSNNNEDPIPEHPHVNEPGAQAKAQAQNAAAANAAATARVCQAALQIIQPLIHGAEESANFVDEVLPPKISQALEAMSAHEILHIVMPLQKEFIKLRDEIQYLVSNRRPEVINRLKSLDDTLFGLFEEVSSSIKSIDLRHVEDLVNPMMEQRERLKSYIQYSWIAMLIITGVFMFIACAFLLGLFFGCCGRRPSLYDDDCCVRSTGSKFYGCGIWLCMSFMVLFSVITATLLFVGVNISHLICHPLEDPLSRPDMLSFLDRIIDAYELDTTAQQSRFGLPPVLRRGRGPAELIRGCAKGQTFYTMIDLDMKYRLIHSGGPMEEYLELAEAFKATSAGRMLEKRRENFVFNAVQLAAAIGRLPAAAPPEPDENAVRQYQMARIHFDVDTALHQLKKALAERSSAASVEDGNGSGDAADAGIAQVSFVLQFLEKIRAEVQSVKVRIDEDAKRLDNLAGRLRRLAEFCRGIDVDAWSKRLDEAARSLEPVSQSDFLNQAIDKTVDELTAIVLQYANHINQTMRHEVSSCEPIAQIARNTNAAVCRHTVDPFNGVWMAMAVSLIFMIPIVILSTRLTSLYGRLDPLHNFMRQQYQAAPTTATDSMMMMNADGGSGADYYGLSTDSPPKPHHYYGSSASGYGNDGVNYGSDDYFNYQHFPPPYGGRARR